MDKEQAAELNTMASEIKNTLEILKALLWSYGDEYACPNDERIIMNIRARPSLSSCVFAAIENYAMKARDQAEELETYTERVMEDEFQEAQ